MSGEDGFLRRWSRLKRQAPPAPKPAPAAAEPPEEIPPPVESISDEEIAGWLKRRVPQAWRVLALRRLWVSDAAIAGFIGPADYQFDWEALGGSPGWGPLRAVDDITDLLSRAIGEHRPPPREAVPEEVAVAESDSAEPPLQNLAVLTELAEIKPDFVVSEERDDTVRRRRGGAATPV